MTDTLIRNEKQVRQVVDFTGMRWGSISPTDFDAVIDFGDKLFVAIEVKRAGQEMDTGQRLAYERVTDACVRGGRNAVTLFVEHTNFDPSQKVDLSACLVKKYRIGGLQWRDTRRTVTCREVVNFFLCKAKLYEYVE